MTDAELIAWLRDLAAVLGKEVFKRAADRIEALIAERDHWKDVAGREGVCMTCRGPRGAPEPYGCSDCLNTGYCGEYHNTVADLGAKLAKAVDGSKRVCRQPGYRLPSPQEIARETLAEIKGESHE